jgi:hypothetical protein
VASDLTFGERRGLVEDFLCYVMKRDLGRVRIGAVNAIVTIWARRVSDADIREAIGILEGEYPGGVLPWPGLYCAMERLMRFPVKEGA